MGGIALGGALWLLLTQPVTVWRAAWELRTGGAPTSDGLLVTLRPATAETTLPGGALGAIVEVRNVGRHPLPVLVPERWGDELSVAAYPPAPRGPDAFGARAPGVPTLASARYPLTLAPGEALAFPLDLGRWLGPLAAPPARVRVTWFRSPLPGAPTRSGGPPAWSNWLRLGAEREARG